MLYLEISEQVLEARIPADVLQRQRLTVQQLLLERNRPESIATYSFDDSGLLLVRAGHKRHLPLINTTDSNSPERLLALDGETGYPRQLLERPDSWQLWAGASGSQLLSDQQHPWALRSDWLNSVNGHYELLIAGSLVLLIDQQAGNLLQLCPHRHIVLTQLDLRPPGTQARLSVAADRQAQAVWISNGSGELLRWHPGSGRLSRFELGLGSLGALALAPDPEYLLLSQGQDLHYLDTRTLASLKNMGLDAKIVQGPILLAPDQGHWLVPVQHAAGTPGVVMVSTRDLQLGPNYAFDAGTTVQLAGFESLNPFAEPAPNLATRLHQLGQLSPQSLAADEQGRELDWPFHTLASYTTNPAQAAHALSAPLIDGGSLNLPGQSLIPLPSLAKLMLLSTPETGKPTLLWEQDLTPLGLTRPLDVRQLPGNRLLVTDGGGRVCELGPEGIQWEMGAEQGLLGPVKAGWFRQGDQERILIVDLVAGRVLACDRDYNVSWEYTALERPCDARITPRGTFLIADSGLQAVLEIDSQGRELRRIGADRGLHSPMAVYEAKEQIFILDSQGPALLRLDARDPEQITGPLSRCELTGPAPYFLDVPAGQPGQHASHCLLLSSDELILLSDLDPPNFQPQVRWRLPVVELASAEPVTDTNKNSSLIPGKAGRLAFLRDLSLFQTRLLKPEALEALAEALSDIWVAPGQAILQAGDSGEDLYLLAAGRVEILAIPAENRHDPVIVTLGPGDVFGEISLLFAEPRSNTIRAASEARLLRLSKRAFHRLSRRYPELHDHFENMAVERRRLVQQRRMDALQEQSLVQKSRFALERLRQLELFQSLSDELVELLLPHLQFKAYAAADTVFEQGDPGQELYFISRGNLDVFDQDQFINTMPEGEVFGEIALVLDRPRTATVKARSYCELYSLNRDSFDFAIALSPELRARLEALAQQRLARSASGDYTLTATKLDQLTASDSPPLASQGQSSFSEPVWVLLPNQDLVAAVSPQGQLVWAYGRHDPQQLLAPFSLTQRDKRLLIADRGNHRILVLDLASRQLIGSYGDDQLSLLNPTSADLSSAGRLLIADQGQMRLIEADAHTIFWQFQDPARLLSPVWIESLPDGNVLYADDVLHQVICIDREGKTLWSYGTPLFAGREYFRLNAPACVRQLAGGNMLIVDTGNHRLLEIDADKAIVWRCGEGDITLQAPTWAQRLSNGHTLIQHKDKAELLEVNPDGQAVWTCSLSTQAAALKSA